MKTSLDAIRLAKSEVGDLQNWELPMQAEVPQKLLQLRNRLLDILTEAENLTTEK